MINQICLAGKIVPSTITCNLLKKAMLDAGWDTKKFLIDGYPRNDDNVQGWAEIIGDSACLAKVLHFDVSDKNVGDRIA